MRERTTWNRDNIKQAAMKRQADPYLVNQNHVRVQPGADDYVTGTPSSFGEDVDKTNRWEDEYKGGQVSRNEIGMPEMRSETFNHPEKTAAMDEETLYKKANLCVRVARLMLPKTASESIVEDQATSFMAMADYDLIETYTRLADDQQGQAQDDDQGEKQAGEMPPQFKENAEKKQEEAAEKKKEDAKKEARAARIAAAIRAAEEEADKEEAKEEAKPEQKQASRRFAEDQEPQQGQQVQAQQQQVSQEQIAQMVQQAVQQAQAQQAQAQQAQAQQAQAQQQVAQGQQQVAQDQVAQDQVAQDQVAQQQVAQQQVAQQQVAQQQVSQDQIAQMIQQQVAQQMAQQGQQQIAQGQFGDIGDIEIDPIMGDNDLGIQLETPIMDTGDVGFGPEDDVLRSLFATEESVAQEAQEAQEQGQGQQKQASVRTASTRTVGTRPTQGVSRIGGGANSNMRGQSDVDRMSGLWASAPDVSEAFGLPKRR